MDPLQTLTFSLSHHPCSQGIGLGSNSNSFSTCYHSWALCYRPAHMYPSVVLYGLHCGVVDCLFSGLLMEARNRESPFLVCTV